MRFTQLIDENNTVKYNTIKVDIRIYVLLVHTCVKYH